MFSYLSIEYFLNHKELCTKCALFYVYLTHDEGLNVIEAALKYAEQLEKSAVLSTGMTGFGSKK